MAADSAIWTWDSCWRLVYLVLQEYIFPQQCDYSESPSSPAFALSVPFLCLLTWNTFYAQELAARLAPSGGFSCSVHPGVIATNLWREEQGPSILNRLGSFSLNKLLPRLIADKRCVSSSIIAPLLLRPSLGACSHTTLCMVAVIA